MSWTVDAKCVEGYEKMISKEIEAYENASTDDERRVLEARLKDLIKSYNEYKSTEDAEDKSSLEREKLEQQVYIARKGRIWSAVTSFGVAAIGLFSTVLGIKATQKNMEVLSEYEREHYIATTAEKKAVEQSIDVNGFVKRFKQTMKGE